MAVDEGEGGPSAPVPAPQDEGPTARSDAAPRPPDAPRGPAPALGVGPVVATNPARGRPRRDAPPAGAPAVSEPATATAPPLEAERPPLATQIPIDEQPPVDSVPIAKGAKLGRYLILDKLGEGGMGVVYAAYDPELDRKIALKILSARFTNPRKARNAQVRLLREAQAMARVSHPNVVAVHDVGVVNDQIFVGMELVDGGTLNRWFRDTPRTWRELLRVFIEAGQGLAAAHAVGLVHRDFKPDNVLLGKDGRVRVTDFGLARLVSATDDDRVSYDDVPEGTEDSAIRLHTPLTQVGAVMGTPAYMSPEQHLGQVPDARSDQFSFCAALYWAVFRKRPFDPKALAAAAGRVLGNAAEEDTRVERPAAAASRAPPPARGLIHEPPREPKVPKWLRRALMRGLSVHPDARYPSMEALLAELQREPRVIQRRYIALASVALLAGAGVVSFNQVSERQQLCSGAERKLAGVWDEGARAALQQAFEKVNEPWAPQTLAKVSARFDAQANDWAAMHRDACEATRIRGEQPEELLSLRMICLDRRLEELRALSALLRRDRAALEKALDAAYQLTPVASCADVDALRAPVPRPQDPAVRQRVEAIEAQLAEVKAQVDSGRMQPAKDVAARAVAEAEATGFAPAQAEAYHWLGWVLDRTGQPKEGEQTLRRALLAAEKGRHDVERLRATSKLIFNVGYTQARFDKGHHWTAAAEALLQRLGGNAELKVEVLSYSAAVYLGQGNYDEAVRRYRQAIELADQVLPPEHPRRGIFRNNLASVFLKQGDVASATRMTEEALALIEASRGADHPSVSFAFHNFALQRRDAGDLEKAHAYIEKTLDIRRRAANANPLDYADAIDILATILQKEGRYADALAEAQRALETKRQILGADHVRLSYSYENMGHAYLGLRRLPDAVTALERAIALREREGLADSELAEPRFALAQALWEDPRARRRARTLAVAAREGYARGGNLTLATEVSAWLQDHP